MQNLEKYHSEILKVIERSIEFRSTPVSNNYILLQVNGIDKSNDIVFISHNKRNLVEENRIYLSKVNV